MKKLGRVLFLETAGGRIGCKRCTAISKSTALQCSKPALRISRTQKCQLHGGRSTGPRTPEGKVRSAKANLKSGDYSQASLDKAAKEKALIRALEDATHVLGMTDAPRTVGRKPEMYSPVESIAEVLPAIMALHHM
jgi:hypothetical protein